MLRRARVLPLMLLVLAACGGPAAPAPTPVLRVVATDFGYTVDGTPTAGPVAVRVVNQGQSLHHAQLLRLEQGKTAADLTPASLEHGVPEWAVALGGPNAAEPGDSNVAYVDLTEGTYALLCVIPDTMGMMHLAHGMVTQFTVGAASGKAVAAAPAADVTLHLKDFSFGLPAPLTAGHHVIQVVNDGPQVHEVVIFRFAEGAGPDQLMAWAGGGMHGPPPGHFVGGTVGLASGASNIIEDDFPAGNYVLLCFLPNTAGHGEPHLAMGMAQPLTVN